MVELVDRGIIRILDLVFVKKELDGSVSGLAIADLDKDGELDLAVFEEPPPAPGPGDLDEAGGVLEPGSSAGLLVYENRWAAPSPRRSGAAAASSSPTAASPSRPCSPPSTPPRSWSSSSSPLRRREASCQVYFSGSHARPWSPGRPRPCPTGCRGGRPTSGPPRSSSRTDRHNRPISRRRPISRPLQLPARRRHGRQDLPAPGARRAEVPGRAHRSGVRGSRSSGSSAPEVSERAVHRPSRRRRATASPSSSRWRCSSSWWTPR